MLLRAEPLSPVVTAGALRLNVISIGLLQTPSLPSYKTHISLIVSLAFSYQTERREQLVAINARLLALVTAFDSVAADAEKLEAAAEVYRDLLSSVSAA